MASSILEGTCPLCDHELRPVGRVNIHKNLRSMFHGIDSAEVFDCDSCTFTYAVIRDGARPEIEPTVLCGHRGEVSFAGGITWVSDQDLQGISE